VVKYIYVTYKLISAPAIAGIGGTQNGT